MQIVSHLARNLILSVPLRLGNIDIVPWSVPSSSQCVYHHTVQIIGSLVRLQATEKNQECVGALYRDRLKSWYVVARMLQATSDRSYKQQQEQTSPNHVPRLSVRFLWWRSRYKLGWHYVYIKRACFARRPHASQEVTLHDSQFTPLVVCRPQKEQIIWKDLPGRA